MEDLEDLKDLEDLEDLENLKDAKDLKDIKNKKDIKGLTQQGSRYSRDLSCPRYSKNCEVTLRNSKDTKGLKKDSNCLSPRRTKILQGNLKESKRFHEIPKQSKIFQRFQKIPKNSCEKNILHSKSLLELKKLMAPPSSKESKN